MIWISLASLVRFEPFQYVTPNEGRKYFIAAFLGARNLQRRRACAGIVATDCARPDSVMDPR
jgi:hypothetical protein